ncbi:hypothetical protein TA3x_004245 [Tundrisphaera sp. TA3]|uniref:hypothetical protein n=1 Tax=Tundrisphaera sp. TA3 TaxID=3435775 RepID=UPI003EBD3EEF
MSDDRSPAPPTSAWSPGWSTLAAVSALYLASVFVATYPAMLTMGSTLPWRVDPIAHIWTMRWNMQCVLQGKLPFFCPNIQAPVGAALGTLPPMHFQTLLFIPLSLLFDNDILCYNLIRTFAFWLTGIGTFTLAWNVTRSRPAACLAGMTAILGMPMIFFSRGELEQITIGWFPLFLVAWTRWVDTPTRKGLAVSALLYVLVAMSSPYAGLFAIFPAVLYVAWRAIGAGRSGIGDWLLARCRWFAAFSAITGPAMVLLFSNQVWAVANGYVMSRPDSEFWMFRAPLWGYLVPSPVHRLGQLLPFNTDVMIHPGSIPSYLGVVTLGLIAYAAAFRVRFERRAYWWAALAMLVVLSMGSHAKVGSLEITLPAYWLKKWFVGFRVIRVPARFNLYASVVAALVAATALKHLLDRLPGRAGRVAVFSVLSAVALADLSTNPYITVTVPPMPAAYRAILDRDPQATFLDAPQFNSGAFELPALTTYWQSIHGGTTSAGYTSFLNVGYDNLVYHNSPFDAFKLGRADYLADPRHQDFDLVRDADFRDYAWLYLTVHELRYVVLHQRPGSFPEFPVHLDRIKAELADAKVYEDADAVVYDRDRLPPPRRTTILHAQGWSHRLMRRGERSCMVGASGKLYVFNPDDARPLTLTLDASGHRTRRTVRLMAEGKELATWDAAPSTRDAWQTPAFRLPQGLSELALESDSADPPLPNAAHVEGDSTPFSLWVRGVSIRPEAPAVADLPGPPPRR